jgi:hypothetical protein
MDHLKLHFEMRFLLLVHPEEHEVLHRNQNQWLYEEVQLHKDNY